MSRKFGLLAAVVALGGLGLLAAPLVLEAQVAGRVKAQEITYEYKVSPIAYNPGERLTDDQRAKIYEKSLNDNAKKGWELVGSIMGRTEVQTVGGGVTSRETLSFLAFKRPSR